MKNLIKMLIAGFIFFFFVILFFRSCQSNFEKAKKEKAETEKEKTSSENSKYSYKTIEYGSEYGENVYLSTSSWFAFIDATEPYCCTNKDGFEACGDAGQDISTQMGDSDANTILRFKSQNGKSGTLKIRTRNK